MGSRRVLTLEEFLSLPSEQEKNVTKIAPTIVGRVTQEGRRVLTLEEFLSLPSEQEKNVTKMVTKMVTKIETKIETKMATKIETKKEKKIKKKKEKKRLNPYAKSFVPRKRVSQWIENTIGMKVPDETCDNHNCCYYPYYVVQRKSGGVCKKCDWKIEMDIAMERILFELERMYSYRFTST